MRPKFVDICRSALFPMECFGAVDLVQDTARRLVLRIRRAPGCGELLTGDPLPPSGLIWMIAITLERSRRARPCPCFVSSRNVSVESGQLRPQTLFANLVLQQISSTWRHRCGFSKLTFAVESSVILIWDLEPPSCVLASPFLAGTVADPGWSTRVLVFCEACVWATKLLFVAGSTLR